VSSPLSKLGEGSGVRVLPRITEHATRTTQSASSLLHGSLRLVRLFLLLGGHPPAQQQPPPTSHGQRGRHLRRGREWSPPVHQRRQRRAEEPPEPEQKCQRRYRAPEIAGRWFARPLDRRPAICHRAEQMHRPL